MRITSVHLKNYKRFTDLKISEIPPAARLVVMIGPNGSGKSSVIDAFLLKSNASKRNLALTNASYVGYLLKDDTIDSSLRSTLEVANTVTIETNQAVADWSKVFCIRSPYRHEADFSNTNLGPTGPSYESARFERIIDQDRAVSDNFGRLGRSALHGALKGEPASKSMDQFRRETLGEVNEALESLFEDPTLSLQDLGAGLDTGAFRFKKGITEDFHYKNLSGGEKAAFDLILDIFVKRIEYQDAIYCIDEPESHVASAIHGRLLETMLKLIPEKCQLWIATHSTGFVRKAVELARQCESVTFLDFSGHEFDRPVNLTATVPKQSFFRKMYDVLQDDLAGLVAPAQIVLCEGKKSSDGTDAKIYNEVFGESYPDTLFVSRGSSSEVEKGEFIPVLEAIVPNVRVWQLIDRDDMPPTIRDEKIGQGIQVLRRREIENYLWDKAVIERALQGLGVGKAAIQSILLDYPICNPIDDDMSQTHFQRALFEKVRALEGVSGQGRDRKEFILAHLAPAIRGTEAVYRELEEDVFPSDLRRRPRG